MFWRNLGHAAPGQAQKTSSELHVGSLFIPCTFLFSVSSQQKCFQGLSHFSGQSSQAKISAEFCYWCRSARQGGEFSLPLRQLQPFKPRQSLPGATETKPCDLSRHLSPPEGWPRFTELQAGLGDGRNYLISSRAGTEFGSCKLQVLQEKLNAAFFQRRHKTGTTVEV